MSRAKVAPTLRSLVAGGLDPRWDAADRELRALLAVVRAAERIPHLDECPAFGFDAPEMPCTCPHKRALRRLSGKERDR